MNKTLMLLIVGFLALVIGTVLMSDDTEQQFARQGCNGQASCSGVQGYGCNGAASVGCAGAYGSCAGQSAAGCAGSSGGQRGALRGRIFRGRLLRGCGG